jgi:hypothetical protein
MTVSFRGSPAARPVWGRRQIEKFRRDAARAAGSPWLPAHAAEAQAWILSHLLDRVLTAP